MQKIQVRNGVFETNSSSSHALTLGADEVRDLSLLEDALKEGVIRVSCDRYFGWEWQRLHRPENKIAYMIAQMAPEVIRDASSMDAGPDEVREALFRKSDAIRQIIEGVEDATGCKVEISADTDFFGVDHDSSGVHRDVLRSGKVLDFILSPKSFIQLGNDNDRAPAAMETDTGEIVNPWSDQIQPRQEGACVPVKIRISTAWNGTASISLPGEGLSMDVDRSWSLPDVPEGVSITCAEIELREPDPSHDRMVLHYEGHDPRSRWDTEEGLDLVSREVLHHKLSDLNSGLRIDPDMTLSVKRVVDPALNGRYYCHSRPDAHMVLTCLATPEAADDLCRQILDAQSPDPKP